MIFQDSILQKLYTSGLQFLSPLTTKELYKRVVDEAKELVGAEDGAIVVKNSTQWKPVYTSSDNVTQVTARKKGYTYQAFTKQQAFVIPAKKFAKSHPQLFKDHIRSVIFIPLTYAKTSFGVLIIRSKADREFNENDLETLKLFGSMADLALHKAYMYEQVKKALQTRDLFMAMAAHELRTPLTTMKMYTQFLEKSLTTEKELPDDIVLKLSQETSRVIHLVHEFTLINQVRTGQFTYTWEACDLNEVIKRAIETVQISHPLAIITYLSHISPHTLVIADREKLMQVIINILNNAIKFSPSDKAIEVEIAEESKKFYIGITDHGPGMPKREIRHIFKEFYKGPSNHKDGMGLGLYLTKMIIEAHKGSISVNSKLHKGTTFTVILPNEGL